MQRRGVGLELLLTCAIGTFFGAVQAMTALVVALHAQSLGAAPGLIGVVLASGFVLPVFLAVHMGGWVDRLGPRPVILAGALGVAAAPLLPAFLPGVLALVVLQIVFGLSHLAGVVATQSAVARLEGSRERNFGWYTTLVSVGQLVGPFALGLVIDGLGYLWAFLITSGTGVVAALLAGWMPRRPDVPAMAAGEDAEAMAAAWGRPDPVHNLPMRTALLASGATLFALGVHQTFFPVYLDTLAISAGMIGLLVGLRAFAAIAIRPFLATLGRVLGHRSMMLAVTLLMCGVGLALVPLGRGVALFAVASILLGLGSGVSQPLTMVVLSDHVHRARRGMALGVRLSVNFFALGASSLLLGALIPVVGYALAFVLGAALPVSVGLWIWGDRTPLEAPAVAG